MTDKADREVQKIAMRINGDPTLQDVLQVVVAAADDDETRHEESLGQIGELRHDFEKHCSAEQTGLPAGLSEDRRVWAMWGVGIFLLIVVADELTHYAVPIVIHAMR